MQRRKVGIGTLFRDSQVWHSNQIKQVDRFFRQIDEQTIPNEDMLIAATIGQSQDNTEKVLMQEKEKRDNLVLLHDEGVTTKIASTTDQRIQEPRIKDLSHIANVVLDELVGCDYIFWQESDLILPEPDLIESLISSLEELPTAGVIAPMVYMEHSHGHFYDTWAFRSPDRDKKWGAKAPHTPGFQQHEKYVPANSIGSCCIMDGGLLLNGVRFDKGAFVELCTQVRARGLKIFVDKTKRIFHPSKIGFVQRRWI